MSSTSLKVLRTEPIIEVHLVCSRDERESIREELEPIRMEQRDWSGAHVELWSKAPHHVTPSVLQLETGNSTTTLYLDHTLLHLPFRTS